MGQKKSPYAGAPRRRFDNERDEVAFKNARNYGGPEFHSSAMQDLAHQNFGTLLVSCEQGDLRALPDGVMIYRMDRRNSTHCRRRRYPAWKLSMNFMTRWSRIDHPLHDGAWAMATLEVLLAILQSSREKSEVRLSHQVGK